MRSGALHFIIIWVIFKFVPWAYVSYCGNKDWCSFDLTFLTFHILVNICNSVLVFDLFCFNKVKYIVVWRSHFYYFINYLFLFQPILFLPLTCDPRSCLFPPLFAANFLLIGIQRAVLVKTLDCFWRDHLVNMNRLSSAVFNLNILLSSTVKYRCILMPVFDR